MIVRYDSETLKTSLEPETAEERQVVLSLIQVFTRGGTLRTDPRGARSFTSVYKGAEVVESSL